MNLSPILPFIMNLSPFFRYFICVLWLQTEETAFRYGGGLWLDWFLSVGSLTTLCVSRLYSAVDRTLNEQGTVVGMRTDRRNPVLVPVCLPQIPHHLTWVRTRTYFPFTTYRLFHTTGIAYKTSRPTVYLLPRERVYLAVAYQWSVDYLWQGDT
jgi:hypothetical protein